MSEQRIQYDSKIDQCPICNESATISNLRTMDLVTIDACSVTCPRCGMYHLTRNSLGILRNLSLSHKERAKISGWLFENQTSELSSEKFEQLRSMRGPSFYERADKLLKAIEIGTDYAGQYVEQQPYWISSAWCSNVEELNEILEFLQIGQRIVTEGGKYKISPYGWARLDELQKINADSEQCFVAMWFDDSLKNIYDNVIAKGISNAGYRPHKVDQREHNDRIDDEIIAQIRRSNFIVADFTGHRGGVYYEAGFAKGLGLEVIWTCRKDDIDNLHFDIRQYNCIDWESSKLPDFMKRLTYRIESVLGKGTYRS